MSQTDHDIEIATAAMRSALIRGAECRVRYGDHPPDYLHVAVDRRTVDGRSVHFAAFCGPATLRRFAERLLAALNAEEGGR